MSALVCTSGQLNCYCKSGRSRGIVRVDDDGNVLESYCSGSDAARKLGFTPSQLSAALRGRNVSGYVNGHRFRFIDCVPLGRPVESLGDDGEVLQSWTSALACSRATGLSNSEVGRVCNLGGGEYRGLYFRYGQRQGDSSAVSSLGGSAALSFAPPPPEARDKVNQCYRDAADHNREKKVTSMFLDYGVWMFNVRPAAAANATHTRVPVDEVLENAEWQTDDVDSSTSPSTDGDNDAADGMDCAYSSSSYSYYTSSSSSSSRSSSGRERRATNSSSYGGSRQGRNEAQEIRSLLKDLNLLQHAPAIVRERFTLGIMRQACAADDDYSRSWLRQNLIELGLADGEADAVLSKVDSLGPLPMPPPPPPGAASSSSSSSSSHAVEVKKESPDGQGADAMDEDASNSNASSSRSGRNSANPFNNLDLSDVPHIEPILRGASNAFPSAASQYKGVGKKGNRWSAKLRLGKQTYYMGTFESEYDAGVMYARARWKIENQ